MGTINTTRSSELTTRSETFLKTNVMRAKMAASLLRTKILKF